MTEAKPASGVTLQGRFFSVEELATLAIAAGMDKKAFRPVLLDLRNQGAFTEFFAILSATNSRQVSAVADAVRRFFKEKMGLKALSIDGLETSTWVLLDFGSFFVHVFQDPTRDLYKLEQLWSKGRMVDIREENVMALYKEALALVPVPAAEETLSLPGEDAGSLADDQ